MKKIRKTFASDRYFAEVQYQSSSAHVCGLKLAIVIHDVQRAVNVCQFDDSHRMSEGIWPFHRHTETGRHFILTSSMESSGPKYLFLEAISFVLKEVEGQSLLAPEIIPELAKTLTQIWLQAQKEDGDWVR